VQPPLIRSSTAAAQRRARAIMAAPSRLTDADLAAIAKLLHDTIAADRPAGGCTPSTSRRALLAFGRRGGRAAVSEQHVDHPKSEKGN